MGSKITIMCYDKTGTLTTSGIEVNGMVDVKDTKRIVYKLECK